MRYWREEERRERDRPRDREKQDDRGRDGEKRPAREKLSVGAEGDKMDKSKGEKEVERSYGEREKDFRKGRKDFDDFKRGRMDADDLKRGRMDSDDPRRRGDTEDPKKGRGELEDDRRHRSESDRTFSGCERFRGHSKYTSKDISETRPRDRHKIHPRSRRSESPPFRDLDAKKGHHTRGDYGRKQGRSDW